jgi:ankyrin repeat protein
MAILEPTQQTPQTTQTTPTMKRIVSNNDVVLPSKKKVKRDELNPSQFVQQIFQDNGWMCEDVISSTHNKFIEPTEEMVAAYTIEVSGAARSNNLEKLQELHASGALMNCCNKFGGTLLNIACRRSHTRIVRFLLEEANVPVLMCDDSGRVALHDALWTTQANFEIVEMLLQRSPELALMPDKRGHTPFDYARSHCWGEWIEFLSERRSLFPGKNADEITRTQTKSPKRKAEGS